MEPSLNFVQNPEAKSLPTVRLTSAGVEHIQRLLKENAIEGYGLRFGVQGGGCSGYSYLLEFEEAAQPDDEVYSFDGVQVFVNPLHLEYVRGSTITYEDGLMGAGFQIDNPNVKRKCGCGTSFDV